jgi:sugar (pentulose or hexulose) kinase
MAVRRGWAKLLAPLRPAGEALGRLRSEWVSRTGLPPTVQVYCGIHDSNAALVAARAHREVANGELTVLSTGTWFVAMRSLAASAAFNPRQMPEGRDVLVNVDIHRKPVPSARFMGGREIHLLTALASRQIDIPADQPAVLGAAASVLSRGALALPTLAPGCGPFPRAKGGWIEKPGEPLELRAAASLYVALMTDVMLELIGARKDLVVEGRFAAAELFVRALAQLRPDLRVFTSSANTDVAQGALNLVYGRELPEGTLRPVAPLNLDLTAYRARWRAEADKLEARA